MSSKHREVGPDKERTWRKPLVLHLPSSKEGDIVGKGDEMSLLHEACLASSPPKGQPRCCDTLPAPARSALLFSHFHFYLQLSKLIVSDLWSIYTSYEDHRDTFKRAIKV